MFRFDAEFRKEFKRNWLMLAIAFSCLLFGMSAGAFSLPFIFPEVIREFGWTREQATLIASAKWVAGALAAVLVGRFIDITGAWLALLITTLIGGCGMVSFLWVDSLSSYYISGLLLGLAGPGAMVAVKVLIARTFDASQGTAMGLTLQGTNLGAVLVPILITLLIVTVGWRWAMAALSIGIFAISTPFLIYGYFTDASGVGRRPPKVSAKVRAAEAEYAVANPGSVPSLWDVMKKRHFWLIAGAVFFGGVVDGAFVQHQVLMLRDVGLSAESIALAISAIGLVGVVGRVLVGNILDSSSNRGLAFLYLTLLLSSILAFFLSNTTVLLIFIGLRAIGHATVLLDTTVMTKHTYGSSRNLGTLIGIMTAFTGIGFAVGPWFLGTLFDRTGSYNLGFLLCALLSAAAAGLIWFLRPAFWLKMRERDTLEPSQAARTGNERIEAL